LWVTCHCRRSAAHSKFHHSFYKQANAISLLQPLCDRRPPLSSSWPGIDSPWEPQTQGWPVLQGVPHFPSHLKLSVLVDLPSLSGSHFSSLVFWACVPEGRHVSQELIVHDRGCKGGRQ
jgi:hypothetical protein